MINRGSTGGCGLVPEGRSPRSSELQGILGFLKEDGFILGTQRLRCPSACDSGYPTGSTKTNNQLPRKNFAGSKGASSHDLPRLVLEHKCTANLHASWEESWVNPLCYLVNGKCSCRYGYPIPQLYKRQVGPRKAALAIHHGS